MRGSYVVRGVADRHRPAIAQTEPLDRETEDVVEGLRLFDVVGGREPGQEPLEAETRERSLDDLAPGGAREHDGNSGVSQRPNRGRGARNRAHLPMEAPEEQVVLNVRERGGEKRVLGRGEEVAEELLSAFSDLVAQPRRGDPATEPRERVTPRPRVQVV